MRPRSFFRPKQRINEYKSSKEATMKKEHLKAGDEIAGKTVNSLISKTSTR
jgi:hypothetical protein